jgi:hypothetical protein
MGSEPTPFPSEYLLGVSKSDPQQLLIARHNLNLIKFLPSGEGHIVGASSLRDMSVDALRNVGENGFQNTITPRAANFLLAAAQIRRLIANSGFTPDADALRRIKIADTEIALEEVRRSTRRSKPTYLSLSSRSVQQRRRTHSIYVRRC